MRFSSTVHWDQRYLNLFLLWLLLMIFIRDGWAMSYIPSILPLLESIMLLPLYLMMITQLIPIVGAIYYVNRCNDMVRYLASKNFGDWVSDILY